ncbi:SIR2 family protein [Roseibium sp.]|uniref:SIR2 family protein n=2 Tax=Roseibium sp. TaxID=1936156 RepID=UPI0032669605
MYTHLHPELDDVPTAKSVLRDGRIGLYRALNIGRLVAVTGSGSTMTHGQPSWGEIPHLYSLSVQTQIEQSFEDHPSLNPVQFKRREKDPEYRRLMYAYRTDLRVKIDEILRQIHTLCNEESGVQHRAHEKIAECEVPLLRIPPDCKIDGLMLLSLCDALLKRLPDHRDSGETRLFRARHDFASKFSASEVNVIASKIARGSDEVFGPGRKLILDSEKIRAVRKGFKREIGSYLNVLIRMYSAQIDASRDEADQSENGKSKKEDLTVERLVSNLVTHHDGFGPRLEPGGLRKDNPKDVPAARDMISTLLNDLRVSRIATLNYDVEIERRILRDLRLSGESEATDFEDLCEQTRTERPHKKRLLIESGVKKGAVSITLNSDNIGEIVNFSSYSRRYEKQVLHLHGRFDDPENLVLTPEDYLRTYAQREISRESFREAQQTLFEGNDVLFVGIGFKEEEVRRPLAQFFANETYVRHDSRRAFLLRETSSCDACFKSEGDCSSCDRKDEEFVLNEYQKLNVYTVLYGGKNYRTTKSWLVSCREALKAHIDKPEAKHKKNPTLPVKFWEKILAEKFFSNKNENTRQKQLGINGNWGAFATVALLQDANGSSAQLLTETELTLLANLAKEEPSAAQLPVLKMFFDEMISRVMARGANLELKLLKKESGLWWDAWGEIPVERRALYHLASERISGRPGYLWARHCPVAMGRVVELDEKGKELKVQNGHEPLGPDHWRPLEDAIESAKEQLSVQGSREIELPNGKKSRTQVQRRILRFAGPRGSGKGTLIRLLMRDANQAKLFRRNTWNYSGAFVAHLSFSMEFASVAKALTRFFARHAAELQAMHRVDGADEGLRKTRKELRKFYDNKPLTGALRLQFANLLQEFTPKERYKLDDILRRYKKAVTGRDENGKSVKESVKDGDIDIIAYHLFIARRESEPRLVEEAKIASIDDLQPIVERKHRLDMLREMMVKYMELAQAHGGRRLFVCLGGLDKLCDRDGDAHNPMHRAMFRILTGTHGNEEVDPPMDLVLIAGRPQTPICFLSETHDNIDEVPLHRRKQYATYSQTDQALKVWPQLGKPRWRDRIMIVPEYDGESKASEEQRRKIPRKFLNWAENHDAASMHPRQHDYSRTDGIHRSLWHSVGLTVLVYCCWREIKNDNTTIPRDLTFDHFVRNLERHENRDGAVGVMNYVFGIYGLLNRSVAEADDKLDDLILRHLVLFGLPVEPLVLLACPMIYRRLLRHYAQSQSEEFSKRDLNSGGDVRVPNDDGDTEDYRLRGWMLKELKKALARLCRRALVLEVHCAFPEPEGDNDSDADPGQIFLHRRFGIHGQIQEMVGHRMQLDVSDEGDLNHHQISLFCSQPQDLPTPSEAHFRMLKDILDKLQEDNRKSLRVAYRHSEAGIRFRRREWDPKKPGNNDDVDARQAVLHLFEPVDGGDHQALAGSLGQIHAIPQRLRAGFSLVRSAFSVGSLSRMENVRPENGHEPPFEVYRGWLRGLMNAATGLRINHSELTWLLSETVLEKNIDEYKADRELIEKLVAKTKDFEMTRSADNLPSEFERALEILGMAVNPEKLKRNDPTEIKDLKDGAANIARIVSTAQGSPKTGNSFRKRQRSIHKTLRHPLYRDEIAWLFNERALTSLIQGRIYDAIPLFRKARFIMSHRLTPTSDDKAYNAVERRINLNLAIAQIERGNLALARSILADVERSSESLPRSTPSRLMGYITGYMALCEHLGGSFEAARAGYRKSLKKFEKRRELRAIGIFKRHFGDLHLANGDLDEAERDIKLAMNAASQAQQRDIWNMAQSSYARLLIAQGKLQEAGSYIRQIRAYSENMGLYGLRAQTLQMEAMLLIKRGELGPAAGCAAHAIALSSRYGMRLRKLSSLVIYGEIQLSRGQKEVGIHVLRNARTEAEKLGYQLKAAQAAEVLSRQDKSRPPVEMERRLH